MSRFVKLAGGVDTSPVLLDLMRAEHLWNQNTTRTTYEGTPHAAADDIWVRFRAPDEVTGPDSHKEQYRCVNWPAWHALPSLRPIVRAIKHQVDAVELGSVLIARLPDRGAILPHDDRGSWAAEYYNCKAHLILDGEADYDCAGDTERFARGDLFVFDNLLPHSVINPRTTPRIALIVSMRCDP